MSNISRAREDLELSITSVMAGDHARLQRACADLADFGTDADPDDLRHPFRMLEIELLHHFDTEEDHLLRPFAVAEPAAAAAIFAEHARLRAALNQLGIDLDLHCLRRERVQSFVDQLRVHVAREEALLYPWAARQLGAEARTRLRHALREYERHAGGPQPA